MALFYPGLVVVLPLLIGGSIAAGRLLGNVAYVLVNEPLGKLSLQAALVLLCAGVYLGIDVVLAFGLVAFWRGKSWGLVSILGILSGLIFAILVFKLWPATPRLPFGRPAWSQCAVLFSFFLLCETLLLMPSVRRYYAVMNWSLGKLIACGIGFGLAAVLGQLCAILSLTGIAHWIKG